MIVLQLLLVIIYSYTRITFTMSPVIESLCMLPIYMSMCLFVLHNLSGNIDYCSDNTKMKAYADMLQSCTTYENIHAICGHVVEAGFKCYKDDMFSFKNVIQYIYIKWPYIAASCTMSIVHVVMQCYTKKMNEFKKTLEGMYSMQRTYEDMMNKMAAEKLKKSKNGVMKNDNLDDSTRIQDLIQYCSKIQTENKNLHNRIRHYQSKYEISNDMEKNSMNWETIHRTYKEENDRLMRIKDDKINTLEFDLIKSNKEIYNRSKDNEILRGQIRIINNSNKKQDKKKKKHAN